MFKPFWKISIKCGGHPFCLAKDHASGYDLCLEIEIADLQYLTVDFMLSMTIWGRARRRRLG